MKDTVSYDLTPTSTAAVVQQHAAATIRRHVPDLDGRLEVLAALGLPPGLAEDPPVPGVADGYRALAGAVLELIRDGAISAQSFSGRIIRSDPPPPSGGYRRSGGKLPTVRRLEIDLREYGPAVFAAYEGAAIMNVRSTSTGSPRSDLSARARDARRRIAVSQILGTPEMRATAAHRNRAKFALLRIDRPELFNPALRTSSGVGV
ncbi:hypothetical protein [Frankia sp. EAN1pec]|uniref:hypothetical protein n=1 Tax=Parafrankia sp. (strain EAN1pec) TaxID=298653 RepID=UPI0002E6C68F